MDEQERQLKLQAGKEALLAFQKKKKGGKKKRRKADSSAVVTTNSLSVLPDGDISQLSLDSSGFPLPHSTDQLDVGHLPSHSKSLPADAFHLDSTQIETEIPHPIHNSPIQNHPSHSSSNIAASHHIHSTPLPSSQSPTSDTGLFPEHNEQLNGEIEIEKCASPIQLDDGALSALEQQLSLANDSKRQLQDDLNSLREHQSQALEETRNEVAHVYQNQVASLQQSLVESEQSLQSLERELVQMRSNHRSEVEKIVKQHEVIRDAALQERDQKHAAHILRLTAELSAQQEFVDGTKHNSDEQEAERIRIIKEGMKDMHEKEIAQLKQDHETEKLSLAEDFQHQVKDITQQMEQVANAKIQEMHAQFMSAHQSLLEQKSAAESNAEQFHSELEQTASQIEQLKDEKQRLEEQYRSVLETHSAEVEEMSLNAHNLEDRVNTWKEKAANLESRLELSGDMQESVHRVQEQYESRLKTLTTQYTEQIASLESVVKQHAEENAYLQEQLQRVREEAQLLHQEEIDQLKSQHGSEVELLEKSISEGLSDKASLEVAEEHMSSMEKQLKAYRRQEGDMNAAMVKLKEEQAQVVALLKQRHEQETEQKLEAMRLQFTSEVETLQKELCTTREMAQTSQSDGVTSETQTLQELHMKHEEELVKIKNQLQEKHTQALAVLQSELEEVHQSNVQVLKQQYDSELEVLRTTLKEVTEHSAKLETSGKAKLAEMSNAHDVIVTNLQVEHAKAMKELQQSLTQKESVALSEINAQVSSLETELHRLRDHESEWLELRRDVMSQLEISQREVEEYKLLLEQASSTEAQLRHQCQEMKGHIQSVESDCHIAQSATETTEQSLKQTQTQVRELKATIEELQLETENMEAVEAASREQAKKLLMATEQLAERNVVIADLQSQNDTLNTDVFTLTQKCQQYVSSIEMLQRQVENAGAVSEEITTLQKQLSELAPIKEHHAQLELSLAQVKSACKSKDEEIGALQSQLEQRQQQVATLETTVQSVKGEIKLHQTECGTMKEQVDLLKRIVEQKEHEITALNGNLDQADVQMREIKAQCESKLKEVTIDHDREIQVLKVQNESHSTCENELRQQLQQQVMSLTQIKSTHHAQQEELSSAKEELNRLQAQLQESLHNASQLQEANEALSAELLMSQQQSQSAQNEPLEDLRSKCEQLERYVSTVSTEKDRLAAELLQLQKAGDQRVEECVSSWEEKVQKLNETIEDLRNQLNAKEVEDQRVEELQERLLHNSLQGTQGQSGLVRGQRSVLEESLSRARRKLSEKLQEKELLEKDLSFHRTELERRLGEKKRLEGLLFEKARFEQELSSQKDQLQSELLQIESKLQLHTGHVENQQCNRLITAHMQHQLSQGVMHRDYKSSLQPEKRK